jgi:hypothetical protein
VVAVVVKSVFRLEMHQNDIFFSIFKNYFWDQHIKTIWKHKKKLAKNKNWNLRKHNFNRILKRTLTLHLYLIICQQTLTQS